MTGKIRSKGTNQIVNPNYNWTNYPEPPIGFDSVQFEMLAVVDSNILPEFDERFYMVNEQHDVIGETPNNDGYRTISTIKTLQRRPNEYIIAQLEEAEQNANNTIVKLEKQVKTIMYALNALMRDAQGLKLTPRETSAKSKISQYVVKINKNDDNYDNLKSAIEVNNNPNIDLGWEVSE